MKKLSIEEKAQKYDEALEKAKSWYVDAQIEFKKSLETIFPELKESEDEKIRQALIKLVTNHASMDLFIEYDIHLDEALAWLEKQGEHNPYSGVSFKYNGHTWGMCARDNGVDILLDSQLFKHIEKQGEQKPACSEEQMKMLNEVLNFAANHESPYWNEYIFETLNNLIRQLQKIKA